MKSYYHPNFVYKIFFTWCSIQMMLIPLLHKWREHMIFHFSQMTCLMLFPTRSVWFRSAYIQPKKRLLLLYCSIHITSFLHFLSCFCSIHPFCHKKSSILAISPCIPVVFLCLIFTVRSPLHIVRSAVIFFGVQSYFLQISYDRDDASNTSSSNEDLEKPVKVQWLYIFHYMSEEVYLCIHQVHDWSNPLLKLVEDQCKEVAESMHMLVFDYCKEWLLCFLMQTPTLWTRRRKWFSSNPVAEK